MTIVLRLASIIWMDGCTRALAFAHGFMHMHMDLGTCISVLIVVILHVCAHLVRVEVVSHHAW